MIVYPETRVWSLIGDNVALDSVVDGVSLFRKTI